MIAVHPKESNKINWCQQQSVFYRGIFFIFCILLHLLPLRFYCVGECWDRNQDLLRLCHWQSDALTTRLDLSKYSEAIQYFYKYFLFQHGHELVRSHCALRNCG
jgi:hypothetical protein